MSSTLHASASGRVYGVSSDALEDLVWLPSRTVPDCCTRLGAVQATEASTRHHRTCVVTHGSLPCDQVVVETLRIPLRRSVGWGRL